LLEPEDVQGAYDLNVVAKVIATGFDIDFDPLPSPYTDSITEYNIVFWGRDTPCAFLSGAASTGSPVHIDGLVPGHRYLVALTTWNAAGGGCSESVRDVTIGGGTPQAIFPGWNNLKKGVV